MAPKGQPGFAAKAASIARQKGVTIASANALLAAGSRRKPKRRRKRL